MGLAAGGRIRQKIYTDTRTVNVYDEAAAERLHIHTLSSAAWEASLIFFCLYIEMFIDLLQTITGMIPPITPIVPGSKIPLFVKCGTSI